MSCLATIVVGETHAAAAEKLAGMLRARGVDDPMPMIEDAATRNKVLPRLFFGDPDEVVAQVRDLIAIGLDGVVVNMLERRPRPGRGHARGRDAAHRLWREARVTAGATRRGDAMADPGAMTKDEREAFLADVHVGILAVDEAGRGPMALPIWYRYVDGVVEIGMNGGSLKARLLRAAGRATLTVQTETAPYQYVSVEGR